MKCIRFRKRIYEELASGWWFFLKLPSFHLFQEVHSTANYSMQKKKNGHWRKHVFWVERKKPTTDSGSNSEDTSQIACYFFSRCNDGSEIAAMKGEPHVLYVVNKYCRGLMELYRNERRKKLEKSQFKNRRQPLLTRVFVEVSWTWQQTGKKNSYDISSWVSLK